jgi:hypothetical protein
VSSHRTPAIERVLAALRELPPVPERPRPRPAWGAAAEGGLIAERATAREALLRTEGGHPDSVGCQNTEAQVV